MWPQIAIVMVMVAVRVVGGVWCVVACGVFYFYCSIFLFYLSLLILFLIFLIFLVYFRLRSCRSPRAQTRALSGLAAGRGKVNSNSGSRVVRPDKDWLHLAGTRTQPCRLSVTCLPGGFWAGRSWGSSFCRLSVGSLPDAFRAGRCSRLKIICGTPPRRRPCPPAKSQHDISRCAPLANLQTTRGAAAPPRLFASAAPVGSGRRRRRRRVPSW